MITISVLCLFPLDKLLTLYLCSDGAAPPRPPPPSGQYGGSYVPPRPPPPPDTDDEADHVFEHAPTPSQGPIMVSSPVHFGNPGRHFPHVL